VPSEAAVLACSYFFNDGRESTISASCCSIPSDQSGADSNGRDQSQNSTFSLVRRNDGPSGICQQSIRVGGLKQISSAIGMLRQSPIGALFEPRATISSCSILAIRKQVATGSSILRGQLLRYSLSGGCCESMCCCARRHAWPKRSAILDHESVRRFHPPPETPAPRPKCPESYPIQLETGFLIPIC
jgi:hypothetical protein